MCPSLCSPSHSWAFRIDKAQLRALYIPAFKTVTNSFYANFPFMWQDKLLLLLLITLLFNDFLSLGEMYTIFIRGGGEKKSPKASKNKLPLLRQNWGPSGGSSTLFQPPRDASRVVHPTNQLKNACYLSLRLKFFKIEKSTFSLI